MSKAGDKYHELKDNPHYDKFTLSYAKKYIPELEKQIDFFIQEQDRMLEYIKKMEKKKKGEKFIMAEIIESTWHTVMCGKIIGVVAIRSYENTWKAYIGIASGFDEKMDEQAIARDGAKLSEKVAYAYFPSLDVENYTF